MLSYGYSACDVLVGMLSVHPPARRCEVERCAVPDHGRYGTTTAFVSSTSTSAESPTTVTPEARVSPSFTTRTSARLPSIVSSATRPCCSAWISVFGPAAAQPVGPNEWHRRLDRHERARAAVGLHRNAKELSAHEVVDVQRAVGEEGQTVDHGDLPNRSPTPRARWRRASIGARARRNDSDT